ncbi:HAD-IIB family hydrolase [Uliginosibacterium sp. H3]|uniref:HAD-IIB family hydrolase n=1 Tax=Uliginosibacterium silvisoli TaxID=3114758 RepID=A0ABU6K964_9RHOO|nr:HAD-IIB family hydrolase [Uliginosibacterium sp. H3]
MKSFYVSDLDGTLLDGSGQLSSQSLNILNELLHDGLVFTVASARSVSSMRPILHGLSLNLPVIEFNGAFITDFTTGEHLSVNAMPREVVESICARMRLHGAEPFISSFDGVRDRVHYNEMRNLGMQNYLAQRLAQRDPRFGCPAKLEKAFAEQVVCLTLIGEYAPLAALQSEIEALHADAVETHLFDDLYFPGWPWLTVHDRRATKDQAIHRLAVDYGLESHERVVFGDQLNDVGMLKAAHRGIAVANAVDLVKRSASHVIGHHTEHAVAHFIREDWLRQ